MTELQRKLSRTFLKMMKHYDKLTPEKKIKLNELLERVERELDAILAEAATEEKQKD
jgi:predicted component of type VI protein secretion system